MGIWVLVHQINSLEKVLKLKQNFQKITQLLGKLRSFWWVHFVLIILFVLKLASDLAVLYGNDESSILMVSTKKQYSSVLKKFFVFQKIYFTVKVLKTFKISTHCHTSRTEVMPTFRTENYFENPQYRFLEEPMLFLLVLK